MKVLLTGGAGQIGWELIRTLAPLGEIVAPGRAKLDLSDPGAVMRAVRAARPDVIVNAAAYTEVDRAEDEWQLARRINTEAPAVLAEEARRAGALLVHYSTDYVFDGAKAEAYVEVDEPNPLSAYGRSKREGEQAIGASGCRHLILRVSWVYSARRRNFLLTMLRLASERDELRVVADQMGAPTWCRMIAESTALLIAGWGSRRDAVTLGTYHLAAGGSTSWHGFAAAIIDAAREFKTLPVRAARVTPITTSEYPTKARRPLNSRLCCDKLVRDHDLRLPDWQVSLTACMEELIQLRW